MDKYEYNLKLDQMKSLCAEENYTAAAEIADTINWNKIKNVNALVKAGEIYEKTDRYQEARDILLMAYDRSPIGRTILYRLAEVAIKMGDFSAAQEYYDEFVEIAPHDNLRYTLQYDMKKAQGADYSELIPILEELNELEYTEEWAFELANLYHNAGMSDKCVEACDELILWFGEGKYVENALELKMLYQPLSKSQEEKYRKFHKSRQGAASGEPALEEDFRTDSIFPQVAESDSKFNTMNLQEEIAKGMQQIISATGQGEVSDTMDSIKKMVEEIPYLQKHMGDTQKIVTQQKRDADAVIDGSLKMDFEEMLGEDAAERGPMLTEEISDESTGQMSIAGALDEWEKTRRAAEAALQAAEQRKLESAKAAALQEAEGLMDKLNDVKPLLDAGVSPKALLEEEYMQQEEEESGDLEPLVFEEQPEPEIHPVLLGSLNPDAQQTEEDEAAGGVEAAGDGATVGATIDCVPVESKADDSAYDAELAGLESAFPEQEKAPEADDSATAGEIADRVPVGSKADDSAYDIGAEVEAMLAKMNAESAKDEDSRPEDLFTEDMSDIPDIEVAEESEASEDAGFGADDDFAAGFEEGLGKDFQNDGQEDFEDSAQSGEDAMNSFSTIRSVEDLQRALNQLEANVGNKTQKMPTLEELMAAINGSAAVQGGQPEAEDTQMGMSSQPSAGAFSARKKEEPPITRMQDIFAQEEAKAEEEMDHEHLTDSQKAVFSYFVPVTGMENQLSHALGNISEHLLRDETAHTGNLIIQGSKGCGKTVLATSMIRALQKETGKPNSKVGKIKASALNKKDIQLLLRKVQGGCLIIEQAGELTKQSVVSLSLLLGQDTSGTLVILEDTSKGIRRALSLDDGFARKFTEKISIPIFTNDELVEFANSYSRELGYEIDELAVLALYNRISKIQRLDQETTLTEVKEIVDEAIRREANSGLRKFFGNLTAKRFSPDDRIYLQEKDFA